VVNDLDAARLRRLAAFKPDGCRVLSLYLDLDPTSFATSRARNSEITSALDAAARIVEESALDHAALVAARADVERVREAFADGGLDATGAHAVALFACGPEDLFEVIKLPRPIATHVMLDRSPWIEPLLDVAGDPQVAVALVDRSDARLFHGTTAAVEELDEESLPWRRADDHETHQHFRAVGDRLLELLKTRGFDVLLLGVRQEDRGELAGTLHPYVRDRVAGDIEVEGASASIDDVRREVGRVCAQRHERKVGEALARLREGLGRGERAAGGLADVLEALNERRVEILLYERGRAQAGVVCPQDGWLGIGVGVCPVDGTVVERRESILEHAAEAAVLQDAQVLRLDAHDHPDLGPHGGIAALLRY
jgi:peptide chain release factor subunit 1